VPIEMLDEWERKRRWRFGSFPRRGMRSDQFWLLY